MVVEINPQVLQFLKFQSWGGGEDLPLFQVFFVDKTSEKIKEVLKWMGQNKKKLKEMAKVRSRQNLICYGYGS